MQWSMRRIEIALIHFLDSQMCFKRDIDPVATYVKPVALDVESIRSDVDSIASDVESVISDMESIVKDVESVANDVESITTDVESVATDVESTGIHQTSLAGDLICFNSSSFYCNINNSINYKVSPSWQTSLLLS
ncbi:hypothetical protein T459_27225 [Capsicum annuum]|uniref:Uncharacterized protein n=1 Tax=Capsicum annuum TaxID=4072 RepID=A0A2G2YDB7_CAPAN|nr:hypothetical protein T459_27225 [Capsicum annuum]